jgi:hypothetical protein
MSTATASRSSQKERIRGPLDSLRSWIRTYVTLEGVVAALLFLSAWFWIGMALDWGLFRLFGQDLVQLDSSRIFRVVVLIGLGGGLLALLVTTVLIRLIVQFSDVAVALVLERQFPKLLGDRLITAVELNDPKEAAKYGYSPDMVRQTINEAADAVDKVPVKEAFDWGRIRRRGVTFLLLMIGLTALWIGGFAAARAVTKDGSPAEAPADLQEVAGMFIERDVLLRNTIWPRRSFLEVVSHDEDVRIPRKSRPSRLVVRAWKYVIADRAAPEGWRQMTWADLKSSSVRVDAPELPPAWKPREGMDVLTVDEADARLASFPVRRLAAGEARWVVEAPDEELGYRAIKWSDLSKERLGGLDVPGIPPAWMGQPAGELVKGDAATLTVDEVEAKLESDKGLNEQLAASMRMALAHLRRLDELHQTLARLDEKLSPRSMRRVARRLVVPKEVWLYSWNRSATTSAPMSAEADNVFTAPWGDIEETTYYKVSGEDYVTRTHSFTCVDRPQISELLSIEERPAYLFYRPGKDGAPPTAQELIGKRQKFQPLPASVSGEATTIDVPIGTSVTLEATCSKPLVHVEVVFDAKERLPIQDQKLDLDATKKKFVLPIPNVRTSYSMVFRYVDEDGVAGERRVMVNPRQDRGPSVRDFSPDDVIRREKGMFLVSAKARIPFRGRVRDDEGLGRLRYVAVVVPSDFLGEQKLKSIEGVGAVPLALSGPSAVFQAVPFLIKVQKDAEAAGGPVKSTNVIDLPGFLQAVEANRQPNDPDPGVAGRDFMDAELVFKRLGMPMKDPGKYRKLYSEYVLTPDDWMLNDPSRDPWTKDARGNDRLDLAGSWLPAQDTPGLPPKAPLKGDLGLWTLKWKDEKGEEHGLFEREEGRPQKRFAVEVTLVADDTYLEGEGGKPNTTPSSETFTFNVVPEPELLAEIGKEEEVKYRDLQRAFKPLPENRGRMADIYFALQGEVGKVELNNMVARCEQLDEVLKQSQSEAKSVLETYERIIKEMRLNQLREDVLVKVLKIHKPLGEIDGVYARTIASAAELARRLRDDGSDRESREQQAKQVRDNLNDLVTRMNKILELMEGLSKLNELIAELARIEKSEEDIGRILKKLHEDRIKAILGGGDPKKK